MAAACASAIAALAVQPAQAKPNERAGVQSVRTHSVQYHDVAVAIADNFVETPCVVSPAGGMGYHYINWDRLDTTLKSNEPEVVLYKSGPTPGSRVLTAVEYVVVDADQNLATEETHKVFGHKLHGPMLGHGPGFPIHYDLHAWVWQDNPNGTWEDWNPTISCP